jgi:hypothetical protein
MAQGRRQKKTSFVPKCERLPIDQSGQRQTAQMLPPSSPELAPRARTSVGAMIAAVLLIIGVGSYVLVRHMPVPRAEVKQEEDRRAAEAEANRKVVETEKQR